MNNRNESSVLAGTATGTWAVALLVLIWSAFQLFIAFQPSSTPPILPGILLGVGVAIGIAWLLSSRSRSRIRWVRRASPASYSAVITLLADSLPQLRSMADSLGGTESGLRAPIAAVLQVDRSHLRILGGATFGLGGPPKELIVIDLPPSIDVTIARASQGVYNLDTLQITGVRQDQSYSVNLMPVRSLLGILPVRISGSKLPAEARRLGDVLSHH